MKLAVLNLILFLLGIFLPCLKVTPHLGEGGKYDFIGHIIFGENFKEKRLSVVEGIIEFLKGGDYFIAFVLFAFTLIFPAYKMFLTISYNFIRNSKHETYERILQVSKYSMLDIFVIGLIVLAIKVIPGGSKAMVDWGALFFFSNIILTKFILTKIKKEINGVTN